MAELEKLLDEQTRLHDEEDKKRAFQILKAVEGLSIWKARELLEKCIGILELTEVHYS